MVPIAERADEASCPAAKSGRPVMVLLDLLSRRGSLRLLWELRAERLRFRPLLAAMQTNPYLLNARLKELRAALIVDHDGNGYGLTRIGRELLERMTDLTSWAESWEKAQVVALQSTAKASSAAHGKVSEPNRPKRP